MFKSTSEGKNREPNLKKEETKYAFPKNPFLAQGSSSIFTSGTSLWANPFKTKTDND